MQAKTREGRLGHQAASLFHVGAHPIPVGRVLRPYALAHEHHVLLVQSEAALTDGLEAVESLLHGLQRNVPPTPRRYRPEMVLLEAIFERVRRRVQPEAPSRLEVVFAWSTRAFAERFCAEYGQGAVVHRCALIEGLAIERDGALVIAAFEVIDQPGRLAGRLREVEERAERYWRAQGSIAFPEVLVRGIVRVEAIEAIVTAGGTSPS